MLSRRAKLLITALALFSGLMPQLLAKPMRMGDFKDLTLSEIRAESFNVIGKNIVLSGNVFLPAGDIEIYADKAVVNIESRDVEASGNIQLYRWLKNNGDVSLEELARLQSSPNCRVTVNGLVGDIWGDKKVSTTVSATIDNIKADRIVGNLNSGYFAFDNVTMAFSTFVCRAERAERAPDGEITITDGEISACNYLAGDNAHYAIGCHKATLTPHATEFYNLDEFDGDVGDHTVLMTNGFWKVYGVPVLWLPVFFKPKDESPGLFTFQWGEGSDWGYYFLTSKRFVFNDYPYFSVKLMADYYTKRGFGYGATADLVTNNSRTEAFSYLIHDDDPYKSDHYDRYRIDVPKQRYDFRLTNLTHITPRLDFRGAFELQSDPYVVRDFFSTRYNDDPQPATYAALEQQFDHFSASLYVRPKVNSFFTTVERLPGFKLSAQRQELFNTNIYYQGDLSMDYLKMDWVDFDRKPRTGPDDKLKNYESFRVDTTHFLYYPLQWDWLNIVPRAGLKMTGYSNSSKNKVKPEDLIHMFDAADLQNANGSLINNYDDDGNGRFRFLGEIGVEASTKIHNTWQDLRSYWFNVDGLRHVMRPYINYTYIPKPNVNPDQLYYFDEIDRIDKQHFVRFGLDNRLQTRENGIVRDLLVMENYWDLYMEKRDGFSTIGDFNTILRTSPFRGLTLSTLFSIDMGDNNGDAPDVYRHGRNAGNPGLNISWLNRWNVRLNYSPIPNWDFNLAYTYSRPYASRSSYSMGSTLTQIDAGSFFDKYFSTQGQEITLGARIPLTPDRRTFGSYNMSYDINAGCIDEHMFQIVRSFHCFEVAAGIEWERDYDKKKMDTNYMFNIYLTGLDGPLDNAQNKVFNKIDSTVRDPGSGKGSNFWR